jgi:hypothetical protein
MDRMNLILLLVALCLSGVSAYYSIVGLAAIFVASFWPVLILATVLEVGKLVLVSWLYNNWRSTPWPIRTYLAGAVLVLMLITSLGIFGFLSKAHNQDQVITQQSELQINQVTTQLEIKQQQLSETRSVWEQLNRSINIQLDANRAQQALANRRTQQAERERLQTRMQELQAEIVQLNQQRTQMQSTQTVQDSKLGAVRYVIQLFDPDANPQDAIKWIILVLVLVCDPLAVLMLMAASQSLKKPDDVNDSQQPRVHMSSMLKWDPAQHKIMVADGQGAWREWSPPPAHVDVPHPAPQSQDVSKLVEMSVSELLKQRPALEFEEFMNMINTQLQGKPDHMDPEQLQKLIEATLESWMNKTLTVTYSADQQDIDKIVEKAIPYTVHKQQDSDAVAAGEIPMVVQQPAIVQPLDHISPLVPSNTQTPEPIIPRDSATTPQQSSIQPEVPQLIPEPNTADSTVSDRRTFNYFGEKRMRGGKMRIPIK